MENNLKKLREERKLTSVELSNEIAENEYIVIMPILLDEYETNYIDMPIQHAIVFANYFNCSLDYLFKRTDIRVRI